MISAAASAERTVARRHAAELLGVGDRRLRRLVQAGRLIVVGTGAQARVTTSSLESELTRRRKAGRSAAKGGTLQNTVPLFCSGHLDKSRPAHHDRSMDAQRPELLSLSRAAMRAGVGDRVFRHLVQSGQIPAVDAGSRKLVSSFVLDSFLRGELPGRGNAPEIAAAK